MIAARVYKKTIKTEGYTINLRLLEYGDGANKLERRVYGPDGYYRPAMSYDTRNVDEHACRKMRGEV